MNSDLFLIPERQRHNTVRRNRIFSPTWLLVCLRSLGYFLFLKNKYFLTAWIRRHYKSLEIPSVPLLSPTFLLTFPTLILIPSDTTSHWKYLPFPFYCSPSRLPFQLLYSFCHLPWESAGLVLHHKLFFSTPSWPTMSRLVLTTILSLSAPSSMRSGFSIGLNIRFSFQSGKRATRPYHKMKCAFSVKL